MSDIVTTISVLLVAILGGWFARGRVEKGKKDKERADALDAKDAARKESETQDDTSLVDRLTRRH